MSTIQLTSRLPVFASLITAVFCVATAQAGDSDPFDP